MRRFLNVSMPGLVMLMMCASCATTASAPSFKSVMYSIHTSDGAQQAVRSIDADGMVHGSHLSGRRDMPIVSMSSERARPEDLREIGQLVAQLPAGEALARAQGQSYRQLHVTFADDSVRVFRARERASFGTPALTRLEAIFHSYEAGYW